MHQLTGFQRDLLYCIAGLDRPSGQSIKEKLEGRSDRQITHGRLYPNLDTLVETGVVTKGEIDRRTNYYAISEAGVEALEAYHEWAGSQLP
ncbi:helix-turn-helix transcriptional regulator [Halomarina oriensis]|uniref:PadR family transcriptional regulator n=1 Tax=Halomarina oriensis TaxID=671145 RepID=A0A6B0GS67_9EURY|nr:PadR family transcriptional regulator [Halomarina oriensis]